jgi:hypothetical protein
MGSLWRVFLNAVVCGNCLAAASLGAQNAQYVFDPNGNLKLQKVKAAAPPQILGQPQQQIILRRRGGHKRPQLSMAVLRNEFERRDG